MTAVVLLSGRAAAQAPPADPREPAATEAATEAAPEAAAEAAPEAPEAATEAEPEAETEAAPDLASDASAAAGSVDLAAGQDGGAGPGVDAPRARADLHVDASAEVALELDSNLARVESTGSEPQTTALATRLGSRLELGAAWPSGHRLVLVGTGHLRIAPDSEVQSEDLAQTTVDAQWTRPARQGAVRAGLRLGGRDVTSLHGADGDRTYRSGSLDLVLVLFGDSSRVAVSVGPRGFQYKASGALSWVGAGTSARGDFPLWRSEDEARSLELVATVGVEQRAYYGKANSNRCLPGAEIDESCFLLTPRRRGDRMHRASVSAVYSGAVVASLEGQLTVMDSNSFGQSWQSLRARAAVTAPVAGLFASVTGTLQAERYPEGLLVKQALETYESLDADNRSSLELRLARSLSGCVELELRGAIWRDLFRESSYQRFVTSAGLVWSR